MPPGFPPEFPLGFEEDPDESLRLGPAEPEEERRNPALLLAAFLLLRRNVREALVGLARRVGEAELTPAAFGEQAAETLREAHVEAARIGRQLAGISDAELARRTGDGEPGPPGASADELFGAAAWMAEVQFLTGFVADLESGRYVNAAGVVQQAAIENRAGMYAQALLGTTNEAWVASQPGGSLIWWRLRECRHCSDCPELAEGSPYTAETLPTVPGAGDTDCRTNCCCYLESGPGATFQVPPRGEEE